MGWWGLLFFSDELTQLEAFRESLKDEKEREELGNIIKSMKSKLHQVKKSDKN